MVRVRVLLNHHYPPPSCTMTSTTTHHHQASLHAKRVCALVGAPELFGNCLKKISWIRFHRISFKNTPKCLTSPLQHKPFYPPHKLLQPHQKPSQPTTNHPKPSQTTKSHPRPSQTSTNHPKPSQITTCPFNLFQLSNLTTNPSNPTPNSTLKSHLKFLIFL